MKWLITSIAIAVIVTAVGPGAAEELGEPQLPAKLHRYTRVKFPKGVDRETLERWDSTPAANPISDAGATLGRVLFYDKRLSANDTVACASCHHQENAFADPRRFSKGFAGGETKRNAMSLGNLRYSNISGMQPGFFWDERAAGLEQQVLMPIQDPVEMGMSLERLESKLQKVAYYPPLFKNAFGSPQVTRGRVAKAVAQFMRAMDSLNSKFDRSMESGGDASLPFSNFTAEENLGKSLFIDGLNGVAEVGCAHCHAPPTFGMGRSFNTGLDLVYKDKGLGARDRESNDPFTPSNDGKFKAPPLRNIELTAPYMHDGRFKTLEEVVEHYSSGVRLHKNLGLLVDENVANQRSGFGYTPKQKKALVAFLKTLTDRKFIADPRFSNPFPAPKN